MVVKSRAVDPVALDLGYLGLFLGLRVNELVTERLADEGFSDVRQSHGYVIQHLIESERTVTELAARMEVTQQAASKVVAELLRRGIIEALPSQDRRTKRIRLSERGWRSVKLARKIRQQIEKRLVKRIGGSPYNATQRVLLECLEELGGMERIKSRRIRIAD